VGWPDTEKDWVVHGQAGVGRDWLSQRDGFEVVVSIGALAELILEI